MARRMSMTNRMALSEFAASLDAFERADVGNRAEAVLQEAAQQAAEAVVIGNQYGPGVPLDTGFARASFRVSSGRPSDGPSKAPPRPKGRKQGDGALFSAQLDTSALSTARIGVSIYVTTIAEYARYLEELKGRKRRNGPSENRGASTEFIAPVEARWEMIVNDAARRVGYGS